MLKAVVIGATGATGSELVKQLLQSDSFEKVTVFVRRDYSLIHPKLEVHRVDFDQQELWTDLVVGDIAFSAMGTTLKAAGGKEQQWKVDHDYQLNFAKAAKNQGVSSFVLVSAIGANANSGIFYSRMKGALEQAVLHLNFKKLLIFQPGLLIRPHTDRTAERTFEGIIRFFNSIGLARKYRPIAVSDLAKKMIEKSLSSDDAVQIITTKELFS